MGTDTPTTVIVRTTQPSANHGEPNDSHSLIPYVNLHRVTPPFPPFDVKHAPHLPPPTGMDAQLYKTLASTLTSAPFSESSPRRCGVIFVQESPQSNIAQVFTMMRLVRRWGVDVMYVRCYRTNCNNAAAALSEIDRNRTTLMILPAYTHLAAGQSPSRWESDMVKLRFGRTVMVNPWDEFLRQGRMPPGDGLIRSYHYAPYTNNVTGWYMPLHLGYTFPLELDWLPTCPVDGPSAQTRTRSRAATAAAGMPPVDPPVDPPGDLSATFALTAGVAAPACRHVAAVVDPVSVTIAPCRVGSKVYVWEPLPDRHMASAAPFEGTTAPPIAADGEGPIAPAVYSPLASALGANRAARPASRRSIFAMAAFNMRTGSHPDRADSRTTAMKQTGAFKKNHKNVTVITHGIARWNAGYDPRAGYISVGDMKERLLDTVFTIAPPGNSPESFRLWEAAACGSIPIVVRNDTRMPELYHDRMASVFRSAAPFVWLDSYLELEAFLEAALPKWRSGGFDAQQADVLRWWARWERGIYSAIADGIAGRVHVGSD